MGEKGRESRGNGDEKDRERVEKGERGKGKEMERGKI